MASEQYYDHSNFRNVVYALNIAVEETFANLLFDGDASRIIYSDNSVALRKRAAGQEWNNLHLPFMNYYVKKINKPSTRPWWNHLMNMSGLYIPELQRKFRYTPIRLQYDSTFFVHRNDDLQWAIVETIFHDSNETLLRPLLEVDGQQIELLAVLNYSLDYEPEFTQKDWFDKNRIHTIGLNFEFDYVFVKDNTTKFAIPETVIFNWGRLHNLPDDYTIDETYTYMVDHFNGVVTETV